MVQEPDPETPSIISYPYRCGISPGCPHLFTNGKGRYYCVFIKPDLVNMLCRNGKCPHKTKYVIQNTVKRLNDEDC